jgi:hypothetical protein
LVKTGTRREEQVDIADGAAAVEVTTEEEGTVRQ